jgi:eukaryotic-like serine/threonine-protein kinase
MAPEQIFGERDIDQQADVWAIGVILYECLAGRRPTEAQNIGQILRIISDDAIVPLEKVAPDLPADVLSLVGSMLQRDRLVRPASLQPAFDVLRRHAPGLAVASFGKPSANVRPDPVPPVAAGSNRSVIPSDSDASPTAATLASTTASTTADRIAGVPSRRRRALTLPVTVAACVGACGLALFFGTRHGPAAPAPSAAASRAPPPSVAAQPSIPDPAREPPAPLVAPAPSASAAASVARRPPRPAASTAPVPTPAPAPPPPLVPKPTPYEHV